MKQTKLIMMAFGLFAMCTETIGQKITVTDVKALPGETVAFTLNLTEGKANTYTALQFDAMFPSTGFTTTGDYSVSPLWRNATSTIGTVDAEGLTTIPVASSETISDADVEGLLTVSFTVGSDVALGEYPITLKNLWFGYGTSSKDYLDDVTFNVIVTNRITLDENSTTAPKTQSGVNVEVKRTINAGEWSTICLPFAMTEAQLKAAFGDDVQVGDFNGYDVEEDDDGNIAGIAVKFNSLTGGMEANHPYIIKVSNSVTEFNADGVDIDPEEEPMVNKGTSRKPKAIVGNYVAGTAVENGCLFLNNNKFWYSVGTTKIKAFRAYFDFNDLLTDFEDNYAEAPAFIVFDEEATGIASVQGSGFTGNGSEVYNLKGQRVTSATKGLYIRNGKKIVIK